jgi:branched-chain amino acid transport system substrate-binding protein
MGKRMKGFQTLTNACQYAQLHTEDVPLDNKDLLHPDYSSYYERSTPSWITWFWNSNKLWSVDAFAQQLEELTQQREARCNGSACIEKFTPTVGTQCFIWGDLHGAFHSLVRDLNKLLELGVITDTFTLTEPHYYLIFLGDVIDRSPFILETLSLVMTLMARNPERVVYIRGDHEASDYWKNFGLKQELKIRARHLSSQAIPFESTIHRFFNTLPLALYLRSWEKQGYPAFVRISHLMQQHRITDESSLADFLYQDDGGKLQCCDLSNRKPSALLVTVRALIKGVSRAFVYTSLNGLQLLMPDQGATSWSLLSCPTKPYQEVFNFFNDAFGCLLVTTYLDDWTLALYRQDVRTLNGFERESYNFLTGKAVPYRDHVDQTPLKTLPPLPLNAPTPMPEQGDDIVIGSINDATKSAASIGARLRSGLALRINQANREGELTKRIRLVLLDDEYTPYKTLKDAQQLIHCYRTDIILQTLGSPTQEALIPLMKNKELLTLFGFSGATIFRTPELTYTINYRTSYSNEGKVLALYGIDYLKAQRFSIIYQDDVFGYSLRDGARVALKNAGIATWTESAYPRNTLHIDTAVKDILAFDPEVILFFGVRDPLMAIIYRLGIPYLAGKFLMGSSFLTDVLRPALHDKGLRLTLARVVPDPYSDLEIAQDYRTYHDRYDPDAPISVEAFEAYINASLLILALKHNKGVVTKATIIAFFQSLKNYEYKGLKLSYDPQTQELVHDKGLWVDNDSDSQWTYFPVS